MIRAEIRVTLKPGVLDPQGATLRRSLDSLGFGSVSDVRFGKLIQVTYQGDDQEAVRAQVERMCREVLSNPVIETYEFKLTSDR